MNKFRGAANRVGAAEKIIQDVGVGGAAFTDDKATSVIEISISCRDLENKDQTSKSDPLCVISHRPPNQKRWIEILRTEMIDNNLNPDFATKLRMVYRFEKSQLLRFHVYDVDSPAVPPSDEDSLGYLECTVANIVSAGAKGYTQPLQPLDVSQNGPKPGSIILVAEELADLKDEVFLELSGTAVSSWHPCFKSKSFFVISRTSKAGKDIISHRCPETIGSNPLWPSLVISGRSLCNGDKDRQLKIEIWRKSIKNEDLLIGFCLTTVNKLVNKLDTKMTLQTPTGKPCKTTVTVINCCITPIFTFMDFIQAGTCIHLCFSIDFTSSNRDPAKPDSLHYIDNEDAQVTNPYEQAIEATGVIIRDYDHTNIFQVYGFGARIPPKYQNEITPFGPYMRILPAENKQTTWYTKGETSHSFPVTFDSSPDCLGIDGVIKAYKKCLPRIQLFGPTNFSPVIDIIASTAQKSVSDGLHYYILIIITDGVITDLAKTKEAIVKASELPMSIIIVGVGEADFSAMEVLDGDIEPISHKGKQAARDIVQFVNYGSAELWMKKTGEETGGPNLANVINNLVNQQSTNLTAQSQLAEEILAEIPEQLTSFMRQSQIEPAMVLQQAEAKAMADIPDVVQDSQEQTEEGQDDSEDEEEEVEEEE